MDIQLIVDGKVWDLDRDEEYAIDYWILSRGKKFNERDDLDRDRYWGNFVCYRLARPKDKSHT